MSEIRKHPPSSEFKKELQRQNKLQWLESLENQQVNIVEAKKLIETTLESIEEFKQLVFNDFSVGDITKEEFDILIDDLVNRKDGTIVKEKGQDHWIDFGYTHESSEEQHFNIELNTSDCVGGTKGMKFIANQCGVEMTEEEAYKYYVRYVIFHELGHALQSAYLNAKGYPGQIHRLEEDAIDADIGKSYFQSPKIQAHYIESERFPESLSLYLINELFTKEYEGQGEDVVLFGKKFVAKVKEVVRLDSVLSTFENPHLADTAKVDEINSLGGEEWRSKKKYGYFFPYGKETIQKVLNLCP